MASSQFKRYRQAFGGDPSAFDPSAIITNAMQPEQAQVESPRPQIATPAPPPENIPQRQAIFDVPGRSVNPNPMTIQPVLDEAMQRGEYSDKVKADQSQFRRDQLRSVVESGLQGFAASQGQDLNFGQALAKSAGVAVSGVRGSMDNLADRRAVEEGRKAEIENLFFNRGVKLEELRTNNRKVDAEISNNTTEHDDRLTGLGVRREGIAAANDRNSLMDRGLAETIRHNGVVEDASLQNAGSNRIRAKAVAKKATASTATPVDQKSARKDARAQWYFEKGGTDEKGNIVDQLKYDKAKKAAESRGYLGASTEYERFENSYVSNAMKNRATPPEDPGDEIDPQ